jgi:MYXO-CTERM domain-containing protein
MRILHKHFTALAVATLFTLALPTMQADELTKRTVVTVNDPIQLPNVVLQPGTYVFKLLDSPSNRDIVQIFDKDEMHLITTILALPNYRLQPTGKTVISFWETPAGSPAAVRAWFYPGDNYGQEFVYPKGLSTQIAATNKTAVPTTAAETAEDMKTAPVTSTDETGQQNDLNTQAYTPPAPEPAPAPPVAAPEPAPAPVQETAQAPAPEPQPEPTPTELPKTASPVPLVGLAGLLSLGGFLALRRRTASR